MVEEHKLYIPVKIKKRKEIVDGIGKEEIKQIVILIGIGALLGYIGHLIKGYDLVALIYPTVGCGSFGFLFFRKNQWNQNSIDILRNKLKFMREQKKYRYKYCSIYEKDVKRTEKRENEEK